MKWTAEAEERFIEHFGVVARFPTLRTILRMTVEDAKRIRTETEKMSDTPVEPNDVDAVARSLKVGKVWQ